MWRVGKSQIFLQEMKGIHEEYVKNVYEQAKIWAAQEDFQRIFVEKNLAS